jgi:phage baseplate assembly protein W
VLELSNGLRKINFLATGADEVIQNVRTIITTPSGTVPFDRDFGIDQSLLDLPIREARARLTVEYIEKIKAYEPRANIKSISFTANKHGQLTPKVVVDIVGT